jgi:molybdenum cofactor synthesis domain-containing protein
MIALGDARAHVLASCHRLDAVTLPIQEALGLVTVDELHAAEEVPPFRNTAVDGYALRAADTAGAPVELRIVGTLAAGAAFEGEVGPGEALRIMTGAPMPAGADAAVMVEDTSVVAGGERVRVERSLEPGNAVRGVGDDIHAGTLLFPAGTTLRPASLGVLASVNVREVKVIPAARVAVLSTGDELVDDGSPLAPGQIRESNRTMLVGAVTAAGCVAVDFGVVRDDEASLERVLRAAAAECDAIVTSGGVSMGDYDVVKAVLARIADMTWMQVAIKPAKPFAFGLLDGTPVFGLPGNPVSSLVSYELMARPALRQMMGHSVIDRPTIRGVADEPLRRGPDGKIHFTRVHGAFEADGRFHVRSTGPQGSHQLAATAAANGLAVLPDGPAIPAGSDVEVIVLDL